MPKQMGFTLVELMIVVSIVSILMAVAIPQYFEYTVRTKISEAVVQIGSAKTSISEYYESMGSMPADAQTAGIATTIGSKYLSAFNYTKTGIAQSDLQAVITGNLGGSTSSGQTIVFTADGNGSRVAWTCVPTGTIATKYLPSGCR